MTYRGHPYSNVLCRVTTNNAFPNQLTCFGIAGGQVDFALLGQYGTVDISPPNQWAATGVAYHGGNGREPFALVSGEVTATELTLTFESGGETHQFKGVPAKQSMSGSSWRGVYTSAMLRTPISLSVTGNNGDVFGQGGSCVVNGRMDGLGMSGLIVELELSRCAGAPDGFYGGYGIVSESLIVPEPSATVMVVFAVTTSTNWTGGYALK